MELQILLESPQGQDDIKIPTPLSQLECPEGSDDIQNPTRMELQTDLESAEG